MNISETLNHATEILRGGEMRRSMGAKARQIAEQYSWNRMASEYLTLYNEVVSADRISR